MTNLHFPSIEAGRVTSLCGAHGESRSSWTTKPRAVTCVRCRALLAQSDALDAPEDVGSPVATLQPTFDAA
jgi:hypothetical protein